jgi:hypothetical protein
MEVLDGSKSDGGELRHRLTSWRWTASVDVIVHKSSMKGLFRIRHAGCAWVVAGWLGAGCGEFKIRELVLRPQPEGPLLGEPSSFKRPLSRPNSLGQIRPFRVATL